MLVPTRTCGLAALLLCTAAWAQQPEDPQVRPGRMYVSSGLLVGSTRLVALGGAYAGIAEGAAAFTSNLSTIAHRKPNLATDWNADVALSYLDLPVGNPQAQDFDNDGAPDEARGVRQLVSGLFLQFKSFGVGAYNRTTLLRYCVADPCDRNGEVAVTLANSAIAGAIAFGEDELIAAVGLYSTSGEFVLGTDSWRYGAVGLTLDGLYRPVDRNFRFGVSLKPQLVAPLAGAPVPLAARAPFEALASPFVLSVGASVRLGPGAEGYNRLSVARLRELGRPAEPTLGRAPPAGRWLLTAQVDVSAPVEAAVPIRAFTSDDPPVAIGHRMGLAPRLGVEHETLPGRLRLRVGAYTEPSPFAGRAARFHATGGFELFLFRYLDDLAVSFSFDFAERFSDVGLSVGLWR